MEDIAIVGIGLRFPGDAKSPEELWKVLERGESQWSEFPKDRLNIDGYYHPGGDRLGSISFRGAHFLKDDVASFDAPFFGVSADEAAAVDPQQRILLEASYEALENAGIRKEDVEGSDTAVYVGSFVKDYEQICLRDPDWQPTYAATGNGIAIMANRISYAFDFHGPSMTIDTGCSGSLVTVHMAAQSLRTGETSLALAAGAGMILTPNTIMPMTALNFLSPDGKCFTFDSRANGYGRGEGIGVVVLKRLSDAIRDNDTIRAVIRGTRVNQDGRTTGITLPSKEAQVANIRAIYKSTGLDFDQTGYVECHGTGTQAGDWRELKAVSETLGSDRSVDNPIVVGSLKPNIGHLEGAAGIAGLIKGVMVLERGHIPPNINFNTPNPEIDFDNWKVKVPQKLMKWPIEGTRRASVNCFGFGGTNAHVILDEAPAYLRERGMTGNHMSVNDDHSAIINKGTKEEGPQAHLFCFSSNEKSGVQRILESQIPYVEAATGHDFLSNYSYTLNARRSNMEWKAAIVASSTTELASKMKSLDADSIVRSSSDHAKAPRICFVFCGQGSQWPKMGQGLMCFHIFRESLEAASQYMQSHLGCPFVLLDEMFRDEDESRISEPAISQPAISQPAISQPATTALQVALVELFQSLGIRPSLAVGHSSGEIAAAFAANALSREAAWEAAYYRGLHAAALPSKDPSFVGGMMAVGMSDHEAREYLINAGSKLEVACMNSPRSVTLSGEAKDVEAVASDLKSKDVFHRILPVSTAYHSQHMRLVADDYEQTLTHLTAQTTQGATMFSSVTGAKVTEASFDGSYWVANMVSPVKYTQAVQEMMSNTNSERPNVFLEVGPRGIMKGPTLDILKKMGIKSTPTYLSPLDRKSTDPTSLLKVIGDLWARGQQIIMKHVVSRGSSAKGLKCLTDLPPYPWNHSKAYWHESHLGKAFRFRKYPRQDLIGAHTADSIPLEPRWRGFLRLSENPWIQDHQVQKTIVYPAAGMICMVLEGMKQIADEQTDLVGYQISNMHIEKPMLTPATDHGLETALNIKLNVEDSSGATLNGSHEFVIYSKQLDGPWERNASGSLQFHYNDSPAASTSTMLEQRQDLLKSCNKAVNPRQLYELLETVGMNYGPLFQNIVKLVQSGDSCLSTIRVPDTKSKMPANFEYPHLIHPATLDSMVQTLFSIESTPMVPTLIESIFVPSVLKETRPDRFEGFSTARRTDAGARADITMAIPDSDKCPVSIKGLHLTSLAEASPGTGFLPNHHNLCTEIVWEEDAAFANPSSVAKFLGLLAFKYPALSILQVGCTASLTLQILEILSSRGTQTPKLARLTIAKSREGSSSLPLTLLEGSPLHAYVEETDISCLDKSLDFHLILVCRADGKIMDILPKHRKPEGYIIECDDLDSPKLKSDAVSRDSKDWPFCRSVTERCNGSFVSDSNPNGVVVLYEDGCTADVRPFALNFANDGSIKSSLDPKVSILTLNCSQQDHSVFSGKVVISMLDFSVNVKTRGFVYHWTEQQFEAFRAVQKAASGIIWITKGANMTPTDPKMSSVVALGRTLMSEDPQKAFVTVDLAAGTHLSDKHVSRLIRQIYSRTFQNSGSAPIETEYTVAGWKVYIPRLTTVDGLNNSTEGILSEAGNDTIGPMLPFYSTSRLFFGSMLKLEVVKPEVSPGCVRFMEKSCPVLQPDEIEIRFDHTLLSQPDHKAIHAGSSAVGLDFFGRVTRFGRNVRGFPPALQVVALVPNGALQSSVIVSSKLASRCLPGFVPSYYVDAYYGLFSMGLFSGAANRKVLVISGLNGRGLAAITICQVAGIEVRTTVSGAKAEEHKAELVRLTGLSHEKILVVKSEQLAKLAKAASANKGFHIVFNSTNTHNGEDGECVRPNGILVRSLDGRSEDVGSARTPDNCAVMTYSLAEVFRDEDGGQSTVESILHNVLKLLAKKEKGFQLPEITPKAFDIQHTTDALRHVGNGNDAGAAMVLWDPENNLVRVFRPTLIKTLRRCLDPEGIYILAGGLGGLGRSIAEHLFANGARHFGFISRTGLSSPEAQNFTFSLDRRGASVTVCAADLTDGNAVSEAIEHCATGDNTRRRIRGVFQCAAVIRDAVFENMTYKDWQAAFGPKAVGSLNLVNTVLDLNERPFFIFLASSAGVIGNRSQANYAAGNCFEDALARKLRMEGQHAVAIDLSPVLGAGMLAEDEKTLDILKNNGFYGIRHEDFIKVVEQAIIDKPSSAADKSFPAQVTLGVGTGGLILQNQPADPYWSRTALWSHLHLVDMPRPNLATTSTGSQKDMKTLLRTAADFDSAKQIVCTGLMHMLAKAMNMLFEEMDEHKPPTAYGVDSLVAVGVRNWVFTNCGVNVSVFEVLSDQTVGELSGLIAERAGLGEQGKESD